MSSLEEMCRRLEATCADVVRAAAQLVGQANRLRSLVSEVAALTHSDPEAGWAGRAIIASLEEAERACMRCSLHLLETDRTGRRYISMLLRSSSPGGGKLEARLSGKHADGPGGVLAQTPAGTPDDQVGRAGQVVLPAGEFHEGLDIGDVKKPGFSTMFPKAWTHEQTEAAIRQAWTDPGGTREVDGLDTPSTSRRADQSAFWPPNPDLSDAFDHVFEGHVTYYTGGNPAARRDGDKEDKRVNGRWSGTGGGILIKGFFDPFTEKCITAYSPQ